MSRAPGRSSISARARARTAELPPLLSSTHDWLLVLAFLAVVVYLFVSVLDRSLGFGLFLLPIVVLMVGVEYVWPVEFRSRPRPAGDDGGADLLELPGDVARGAIAGVGDDGEVRAGDFEPGVRGRPHRRGRQH